MNTTTGDSESLEATTTTASGDSDEEGIAPVCQRVIAMYVAVKIIISVVGLVCNLFTIYIFFKERKRYSLFRNIIALAIVDCCVLVAFICDSVISHYVDKDARHFDFMFVFSRTLVEHVRFTNIWMTVCLCYERYKVVCKSATMGDKDTNFALLRIFLAIIFSFLISLPEYLDIVEYPFLETELYRILFEMIIFYLFLLIVPTVLLVYYTYYLRKNLVGDKESMVQTSNQQRAALTKSLIAIIVIFLVANAFDPVVTIDLVFNNRRINKLNCYSFYTNINDISEVLMVINSSINFFIYMYFNEKFKEGFFKIFKPKNNQVEDVSSVVTNETF